VAIALALAGCAARPTPQAPATVMPPPAAPSPHHRTVRHDDRHAEELGRIDRLLDALRALRDAVTAR
jgi:hypothetical protein